MSPSMLKTASATTSFPAPGAASERHRSRSAMSLCLQRTKWARERMQPSTMLAWLSLSEMTTSPRPTSVETVARFVTYPLEKTIESSAPVKEAIFSSSSRWRASEPARMRTPCVPVP